MSDYGRRIVMNLEFDAALSETSRALREEGLQVIARIDVRDRLWRDLRHHFGQYFLLEAWSPEVAAQALERHPDAGPVLPTIFALYPLADRETAVVASEPFSAIATDVSWRRDQPALAAIADRERERMARVFGRLHHVSPLSTRERTEAAKGLV